MLVSLRMTATVSASSFVVAKPADADMSLHERAPIHRRPIPPAWDEPRPEVLPVFALARRIWPELMTLTTI